MASKAAELKLQNEIQTVKRRLKSINNKLKDSKTTEEHKIILKNDKTQAAKELNKAQQKLKSLQSRLQKKGDDGNQPSKKPRLSKASTVTPQTNTKKNTSNTNSKNKSPKRLKNDALDKTFAQIKKQMDEQEERYKKQCEDFRRQIEELKRENQQAMDFMSEDFEDFEEEQNNQPNSQLPTPILTPQTSFSDIPQDFQQKALEKLYSNVLSQKLITALEWSTQFSGDGMSAEDVLNFRKKVQNWFNKGKQTMGWEIGLAITKVLGKMTGTAEKFAQTSEAINLKSEKEFFKWFDITFNVAALRNQLYLQCKAFKITENITLEQIVPIFKMKYNLLQQTSQFVNPIIKKNTTLTIQQQIEAIEFSLKPEWKQAYNMHTMISATTPTTIDELQERLKKIALANRLSNKNNTNKTPSLPNNTNNNTSNTDIDSVNNIQNTSNYNPFRNTPNRGRGNRGRNGRGRGGYSSNNRDNIQLRQFFPPSYHYNWGRKCPKCNLYGHIPRYCRKLHKYYPQLLKLYDKTYRDNKNNKNNSNPQINNIHSENNNNDNSKSEKQLTKTKSEFANLPTSSSFVHSSLDTSNKQ